MQGRARSALTHQRTGASYDLSFSDIRLRREAAAATLWLVWQPGGAEPRWTAIETPP